MTWPSGSVDTTDTDSGTDSPAAARADILDLEQKVNLIIAHVSSYIHGLLDDANAAAAQAPLGLVPGTNVEAWDADLDALAALGSTGIAVRSAANTWLQRAIAGTANQITLTNGDGVSGNPTVSLPSAITLPGSLTMAGLLDLGSTGQIKFPSTQNASANLNTLDDYERGNFTPSLGGTTTYNTQVAAYTKIGNRVFYEIILSVASIGTGSTTTISGLPFTPNSIQTHSARVTTGSATNIVSSYGTTNGGLLTVQIFSRTAASAADAANAIFANGATVNISGVLNT